MRRERATPCPSRHSDPGRSGLPFRAPEWLLIVGLRAPADGGLWLTGSGSVVIANARTAGRRRSSFDPKCGITRLHRQACKRRGHLERDLVVMQLDEQHQPRIDDRSPSCARRLGTDSHPVEAPASDGRLRTFHVDNPMTVSASGRTPGGSHSATATLSSRGVRGAVIAGCLTERVGDLRPRTSGTAARGHPQRITGSDENASVSEMTARAADRSS